MSGQENIVHASDSPENAAIEVARFFKPDEVFDFFPGDIKEVYCDDELQRLPPPRDPLEPDSGL